MKKLLLVLLLTLFPVIAHGATYYVATTGSDSNSCRSAQSQSTPKRTINADIGCMRGGETVIVANGTYTEGVSGDRMPNGTSSAYTTVKAANFRGATLKPSSVGTNCFAIYGNKHFLTFDGFVCDRTGQMPNGQQAVGGIDINAKNGLTDIKILNAEVHHINGDTTSCGTCAFATTAALSPSWPTSNVVFDNLYVHDIGYNQAPGSSCNECYGYGAYLSGSGFTIQNSTFQNISGFGIHGYTSAAGGGARLNIIRNNTFINTGSVYLCQDTNQIINNVLNNVGQGIGQGAGRGQQDGIVLVRFCPGSTANNVVYHNTIYQSKGYCINLGNATNTMVQNNICYQNGSDSITAGGSGNVTDHNLFGINPLFVNAAGGDFHLQSGSPAIGAGVVIPGLSFNGSAPDLGALESGAGEQLPAPTRLRRIGN